MFKSDHLLCHLRVRHYEWQLSAARLGVLYSVLPVPFIPHLWCVLFRYREMSQAVLTILHTGLLSRWPGAVRSVFELLVEEGASTVEAGTVLT